MHFNRSLGEGMSTDELCPKCGWSDAHASWCKAPIRRKTDQEIKEEMISEMLNDIGIGYDWQLMLCDRLIRKGWRKHEPTQ